MRCRRTLLIPEIPLLLLLLLEIIWSNASPTSSLSLTDYFYIYDTAEWTAIANVTRNPRDPDEYVSNYYNSGAGPSVNITAGAYHTDQYQLFPLIFGRALKDPRRTLDPSKATTFLIPYDFASDAAYYKKCRKSEGLCFDFRKCPLAPTVSDLLQASPWYNRNNGKDHLMIIGMNYAMNHHVGKPKCKKLLTGACFNCTKLAIDEYSFLQATDAGVKEKGEYWHAIPFPANFHWTTNTYAPYPWENTVRPILSSYVGSSQSHYGPARKLRQAIVHYCEKHKKKCAHNSYGTNGTRQSHIVEGHNPLLLSANSVFCFQPIGDLMTRKGLFDSILQGCIPVTFDPLTASSMYTWHWEEEFWKSVSVHFDYDRTASRTFDPVLALQGLILRNATLIAKKQELIRSRVFELQYALHGKHETVESIAALDENNSNDLYGPQISDKFTFQTDKINEQWPTDSTGRPMRDAYDIIMDHVLGWHSGKEPDVRKGSVPECWNGYLDVALNKCFPHPKKEVAVAGL